MEERWGNVPDAFALPFREFQKRRQTIVDGRADPAYWATPEGLALLAYRDALDAFFWEVRVGVGDLEGG